MQAGILGRVAAEQMRMIEESDEDGEVAVAVTIAGIERPDGVQEVRSRSNGSPATRLALLSQAQQAVIAEISQLENQLGSDSESEDDTEQE